METVAVIRGGTTHEHEHFYAASEPVLSSLRQLRRTHHDVTVSKAGELLHNGKKRSIDAVLTGVHKVFVLLPNDCEARPTIETVVRLYKLPTYGLRSIPGTLLKDMYTTRKTTSLPNAKYLSLFVLRSFRGESPYVFTPLERVSAERTFNDRPSWMTTAVRQQVIKEARAASVGNNAPLLRLTCRVLEGRVEVTALESDASLLFSPALRTSCELSGLSYTEFIHNLIESTV